MKETIQDILYLLGAWERGAYAEEYSTEIDSLRQALAQPDKDNAAELRRLHEVNQELLEALQNLCEAADNGHVASYSNLWDDAKAAITKATGELNE